VSQDAKVRVLICPDVIGSVDAAAVAAALSAGWPETELLLRPLGEAGGGFVSAWAARRGVEVGAEVVDSRLVSVAVAEDELALAVPSEPGGGPIPDLADSRPLGAAVRALVDRHRPDRVWVDLVSDDVHDGGAGFLAELERPQRNGVQLAGVELIGLVPKSEREQWLLGLRGITSLRGRAAGEDPARLLSIDAALAGLAASLGVEDQPGAGACGGVGLAVLALGGRLATGPEVLLEDVRGQIDLMVTGCTRYDFASRGGGVVAAAAELASRLLCPCVVVAGEVLIGGREMRTMGVEAAYGLDLRDAVTGEGLRNLAVRVGRSWRW
jgi:glycerate 2-kinase